MSCVVKRRCQKEWGSIALQNGLYSLDRVACQSIRLTFGFPMTAQMRCFSCCISSDASTLDAFFTSIPALFSH
jgi:hypothetical protein